MDADFLVRVPEYYQGLPWQQDALRWIWSRLDPGDQAEGMRRWRSGGRGTGQIANRAIFRLPARKSPQLIWGNLFFFDRDGGLILDAVATSGEEGYQSLDDQWVRGRGLMPALSGLLLDTEGYPLDTPGIEGHFFPIYPIVMVNPRTKQMRSEIGLHLDANYAVSPGSAGCVVVRSPRTWQQVKALLKRTREQGITKIPLACVYS